MNHPGRLPDALQADAETKCGRLLDACRNAGVGLPQDPEFCRQLLRVLAFSDFAADSVLRDPTLLAELSAGGELQQTNGAGRVAARLASVLFETADADDLSGRLRRFRRRELVRIAWRDIVGLADLTETTADLSAGFDLPAGKYYWRVRALDTSGGKGPWSEVRIVKVTATP